MLSQKEVLALRKERWKNIDRYLMDVWQARWRVSERDTMLFRWIWDVGFAARSHWFCPDFAVIRFLTGYGESLYDRGLVLSPCCACERRQSAAHLLVDCPLTVVDISCILGNFRPVDVGWYLLNASSFSSLSGTCNGIVKRKAELCPAL